MRVPGQLCKHPLHEVRVGPCDGEGPHVLEVARREALCVGELRLQVRRDAVDDLRAPPLRRLPRADVTTDAPVEADKLAVDRTSRPLPCLVDARLHVANPIGIARRRNI